MRSSVFGAWVAIGWAGLLILTGCGGGSGSSNPTINPPTTTRTLVEDLEYRYDFQGSVGGLPGYQGTFGIRTFAASLNEEPTIMEDTLLNVSGDSGGLFLSERRFLRQNANRDILQVGDVNAEGSVSFTPELTLLPGVYQATTQFSQQATRPDVGNVTRSFRVIGTERVTVPLGTFDCWKVEYSQADATKSITATAWIDPRIAYPVKQVIQSAENNGSTYAGTVELRTTNALP
jgi:hypothetical protein